MRIVDEAVQRERQRRIQLRDEKEIQLRKWTYYKFRDVTGEVLFEKVRKPLDAPPPRNKTFWYQTVETEFTDGRVVTPGKPAGADAILYHLPQLLAAKAAGADVWWTEGEKDADRVWDELEAPDCAVSHHQAAGHSSLAQAEWFRGHTGYVGLLMDLDADNEFGHNPGVLDVITRYDQLRSVGMPMDRIRVLAPRVGKDVYDHLEAGYGLSDLVPVTDLRPLREKAELTRSASLWGWGYGADLGEWADWDGKWTVTVVPR